MTLIAPPSTRFKDEYDAFSYQVLFYSFIFWMLVSAAALLLPPSRTLGHVALASLLLNGLGLAALRVLSPRIVAALWLATNWIGISLSAVTVNGINNNGVLLYIVVMIYAAVLLPFWCVGGLVGLSVATCVMLVIGESRGWLPFSMGFLPTHEIELLGILIVVLVVVTGIVLVGRMMLQRSLTSLQQQRQALEEHNALLKREIERRQDTEAALRARASTYRLLFENAGAMAVVYDKNGRIRLANKATATFLGKAPEDLIGQMLEFIFAPIEAAKALRVNQRVIDSGEAESYEWQTVRADGQPYYLRRTVIPLPAPPDKPDDARVLVLASDLSMRREVEKRTQDLVAAEEKNTFFTEFLATVSHDLKTPLNVLRTSLHLIERSPDTDKISQRVARINENVDLLEEYIQDMLMMARLQTALDMTMRKHPLDALLHGIIDYWTPLAEARRIELRLEIIAPETLPLVLGDEPQLHRAFTNLLENALNYTPEDGRVQVRLQLGERNDLLVTVRDTGIGIPTKDLPRIFERFYRSDSAREQLSSGTGLGLAIVKTIIERHGGRIQVESTVGAGTTFSVYLPTLTDLEL